jgi:hypothetical protein
MKREDMTFDELVEAASCSAISRFMTDGGKGLKAEMHLWMWQAIDWSKEMDKQKKKKKKKK